MKNIPWDIILNAFREQNTEKEKQILSDWLSEDGNPQLYEELRLLHGAIRQKSESYVPDKNAYWEQLSKRIHPERTGVPKKQKHFSLSGIWQRVAVAVVLILAIASSTYYIGRKSVFDTVQQLSYSTYGGKSKLVLPDGTEVWLHGVTTISYPAIFSGSKRQVSLSGEAFFEVAKNPEKPFIVDVLDQLQVNVLGTKFNIMACPKDENVIVSLNEGMVRLTAPSTSYVMHPGNEATYNKATQLLTVQDNADVEYQSVWKSDKLRFENETLGKIAKTFEKWYNVEIEVDEAAASEYSYTFTLQDEPLEEILRLMNSINHIQYTFIDHDKLKISK